MHAHTRTHTHTYAHTHTHTRIHTHTHTRIHTQARMHTRLHPHTLITLVEMTIFSLQYNFLLTSFHISRRVNVATC